jgi:hypothetical protein
VTARRGFGDEIWRLAREGDSDALDRAADLLLQDPDDLNYEGHRARSFAHAVRGERDEALALLNAGWTEDWPFPAAYATDVARVRYLCGDDEKALDSLLLACRGAERVDGSLRELATAIVERRPKLVGHALRVAFAGGTTVQRLGNARAVLAARL